MIRGEINIFLNLSSEQQHLSNDLKYLSKGKNHPEHKSFVTFGTKIGTIIYFDWL